MPIKTHDLPQSNKNTHNIMSLHSFVRIFHEHKISLHSFLSCFYIYVQFWYPFIQMWAEKNDWLNLNCEAIKTCLNVIQFSHIAIQGVYSINCFRVFQTLMLDLNFLDLTLILVNNDHFPCQTLHCTVNLEK